MFKNDTTAENAWYAAFRAHDARFDGRIYVGVSSTGIYCRPVCRVRMPRREYCTFYISAAAAEAAGYRPCRKCRPELAPGLAPVDANARLARTAALLIEDGRLCDSGISDLAAMLGITDRHLRRVFAAEFGVPPVQYVQTKRLLLAKSLLTDTCLSVTEIAFTAGFGSIRRFNQLFSSRYRMTPTDLRNGKNKVINSADGITLLLGYRPPFRWRELISFLVSRTVPGVESVDNDSYQRTVAVKSGGKEFHGWISVSHMERKSALAVTISPSLLPVIAKVMAAVRNLFDMDCEPMAIHETLSAMNELEPNLCKPGTRLPGCFDSFEMAVRAILGQQITVKAARTLAARVAAAFGTPISTPLAGLTHIFPRAETICQLPGPIENHLGPLGIIRARARSIAALAAAIANKEIQLSPLVDPETEMQKLLALPGFGPWTVQYLAMRALGWPDAFPYTDYGVKKALARYAPGETRALSEKWRPWRSYATINLWSSLQTDQ
ncbi:MAG: helix-turn-helix domain-containing protein [Planctomycetes bacterium]|nr:helix-turn-helix domain-containing protein [Planctomycetota bacterium]